MEAFEAARILFRHSSREDARKVILHMWEKPEGRGSIEFKLFGALMEIWTFENPKAVVIFLETLLLGEGELHAFWERRSLAERGTVYDWHGQIALSLSDTATAFDSFSRAASLGRDTSLLWRQLGSICVQNQELDLGLRYIRRSLQLFRQLDFDLLSGRDHPLGGFSGEHPLRTTHGLEDYLQLLLVTTKLAKGQKNLKGIRELVVEMIHQFPDESRLQKIRVLLEKSIVEHSLELRGVHLPLEAQAKLNA